MVHREHPTLLWLLAALVCACSGGAAAGDVRILASGKAIEVVTAGSAGPKGEGAFWFEYKSSATTRAELVREVDDVWPVIRPEAERAGVAIALVEATDPRRHLSVNGWRAHLVTHEVGCRSYERVGDAWTPGEVGCCTMRPCLVRHGR